MVPRGKLGTEAILAVADSGAPDGRSRGDRYMRTPGTTAQRREDTMNLFRRIHLHIARRVAPARAGYQPFPQLHAQSRWLRA